MEEMNNMNMENNENSEEKKEEAMVEEKKKIFTKKRVLIGVGVVVGALALAYIGVNVFKEDDVVNVATTAADVLTNSAEPVADVVVG